MYHHDSGPHIEEVFDPPSRRTMMQEIETHPDVIAFGKKLRKIKNQPESTFLSSADRMEEIIDAFRDQIAKWEEEEELNEPCEYRQLKIEIFTQKKIEYQRKNNLAVDEFYKKRNLKNHSNRKPLEESRRREEPRDRVHESNIDITHRGDSTSLNHYSRHHYSQRQSQSSRFERERESDEEEENSQPIQRYRSRSPKPSYSYNQSTMQQSQRDDTNVYHRSHQSTSQPPQVRMRSGKSRVTKTHNRKFRPGQKALAEIRKYQKSTDMLIQKAPFVRLVHEIIREQTYKSQDYRIRADALMALQEAAEAFMVEMFEGSVLICNHAKRVTLMPTDIQLYRRLCLRNLS
ncbi:Protein CBR-CPAR-1 [Caenorhabditis briggsae]|uniref:Histone H3-like centromeric protein cpar-1 n=2 Tax=Caenorhabditis briggsae TaxID=6238 RepID=HCP3L_CAEBR|nr:Protein CBR-CPAR-1 [Caenorhabditis briggsae]A8XA80.1 RecName: Full=Histone H3-like centromeric protein cpar-1; AltName: Full=CENP-A-related protein 1; AltName: Full=Centromeric protein A related [Caenorhabditis briggsae]ULU01915.1 hypothetical protein L3Y34_001896 [Caenorhabditis briggsae]UMM24546.1 hypothetical protein L5515_004731 [Caenorhabditis briggsae]CAP29548.1 Protein CBR-CPAR-1 [Caenorhabditis briggsae]